MKRLICFLKSDVAKIIASLIFFISAVIFEQSISELGAIALYISALLIAGGGVFISAVRGILRRDLLDEKFLMSIASVGAMIIGEWREGVAVMIFFLVGETFEHYAVRKSRASIRSLMDICPDEACLIGGNGEETVLDAEDVAVGSTIIIRPGERVPIDSVIIKGSADVDTSSMTGESIPVAASVGDELSSGFIVTNGLLYARTVREAGDSAAARILALVEDANESKSAEESFITRFSHYYTPVVVIIALLVALVPPVFGLRSLADSVYTALTFLVISCPCALVISVPMAFFGGIGGAASKGILFKGGSVFSKVSSVHIAAFDKTGTLTNGKFIVSDIECFDIDRDRMMYLVSSAESLSNHPIADCLKNYSNKKTTPVSAKEYAGEGVEADIDGVICAVGNARLMQRFGVRLPEGIDLSDRILVAIDRTFNGVIRISDELKPEAGDAIKKLRSLGVEKALLLSGDRKEKVDKTAVDIGVDEAYGELSPEEKYNKLTRVISDQGCTMYVGDGINDSPSLAIADVGVAMGGVGQDSAIEAADLVIMTDNLMKIPQAILIARKTINISWQNIVFALGVKGIILILGLFGFANMWLAVFADVGVAVLAILNSMRALKAPRL